MADIYYLEVHRESWKKPKAPGNLFLFYGEELSDECPEEGWDVYTGKNSRQEEKMDPYNYGGATPYDIEFTLLGPIRKRKHPLGHEMTMTIIYPEDEEDRKEYYNRTFHYSKGSAPFMIHYAGTSTGCVTIPKHHWKEAVKAINRAYKHNHSAGERLKLIVIDETPE